MTAVDPPKKILVVEDNPIDLRIIKETLRNQGYKVDSSINGLEAVDLLVQSTYDLVITDLLLPLGTGFDVVQTVRENNPHLPILVCSSYLTREIYSQLRSSEPIQFLSKPFPLQELLKVVRELLGENSR